jgi:hypothetical protein
VRRESREMCDEHKRCAARASKFYMLERGLVLPMMHDVVDTLPCVADMYSGLWAFRMAVLAALVSATIITSAAERGNLCSNDSPTAGAYNRRNPGC